MYIDSFPLLFDLKLLGRFEKFYSNREAQMIEGEKRYCVKLLSLLRIKIFTMKRLKARSSSLNLEYKAPYKGDNN